MKQENHWQIEEMVFELKDWHTKYQFPSNRNLRRKQNIIKKKIEGKDENVDFILSSLQFKKLTNDSFAETNRRCEMLEQR